MRCFHHLKNTGLLPSPSPSSTEYIGDMYKHYRVRPTLQRGKLDDPFVQREGGERKPWTVGLPAMRGGENTIMTGG